MKGSLRNKGDIPRTDDVDVPSSVERDVSVSMDMNVSPSELREDPWLMKLSLIALKEMSLFLWV